ncbi:MAG: DUF1566 domain-containing protein [Sedimenticola sp.]
MKKSAITLSASLILTLITQLLTATLIAAPADDTGQVHCFNNSRKISCPGSGSLFHGQDAQYSNATASFRDNGNGTVDDLTTGLMWSKSVDAKKVSLKEAKRVAREMNLGGYTDWRVPHIKALYSLTDFRGYTGFPSNSSKSVIPANATPYINTDYFDFRYGNTTAGERFMDAQWLSSTQYVSTTMNGDETLFGVNFADGRIKGYGYSRPGRQRREKKFYARYGRGNAYGTNHFVDNGNGTVSDHSSGLTRMQRDSGKTMNWQQALAYAENLEYAGHDDWRLPNA